MNKKQLRRVIANLHDQIAQLERRRTTIKAYRDRHYTIRCNCGHRYDVTTRRFEIIAGSLLDYTPVSPMEGKTFRNLLPGDRLDLVVETGPSA